ncbi:hypothetical protein GCM10007416_25690 [Kroppenstedtia guangzhouensis]|uniref:ABC transporter domain-containing protein n=1 Tax=Kroppenstedtia guangzhouensis TaxID=1274356 RepID=A0ABQ1GVW1_9BACL|nr:hypothetical protein GCM10007416_25690 [Kroppenstedtia guangzhouensis]
MIVTAIVQTENLTRRFGNNLSVNQVDLQVPSASIYGFLGPNGAGKTTTLKLLLGLLRPTAGSIRIFGEKMPEERISVLRQVGSLVESPSFYGHLSGFKNLKIVRSEVEANLLSPAGDLRIVAVGGYRGTMAISSEPGIRG